MDPEQVGRIVIAGVKADSSYIITHPETRGARRPSFRGDHDRLRRGGLTTTVLAILPPS